MQSVVESSRYSNQARIELIGESAVLERRLNPVTRELNSKPLRVSPTTWRKNLEAAEESAHFNIDYCRYLSNDDTFRPNSSADCKRVLDTDATDKDSLAELGTELANAIIDARSAISRWSQLRAWKPFVLAGSVWPTWDSLGTPHGRYSSEGPCLNNRIDAIRETIEPDPGYSFLSMDLSQAEYVTWASLSGDQVLATLFLQGKDFHSAMAEEIQRLISSWKPEDLRAAGKMLNFAILYQMQPHTLARKLNCSIETASKIIDAYYERAFIAKRYLHNVLAQAEYLGYVETYFGRRRYCPEYQLKTSNRELHEVEKTIWHHHNAGTAAEVCKFKQADVWESLRHVGFEPDQVRLVLQMYDETIWMVRDDVLNEVADLATGVWNSPIEGFLPFNSTVKVGKSWGEVSK